MKKLLFVTALLAMGTMAMGANLADGNSTKAEVEVRAHVIDDKFTITDIYGQPLVLNFKEVMQGDTDVKASVRYKVSMKEEFDGTSAKFTMDILGDTLDNQGTVEATKTVEIANTDSTKTEHNTMTVKLGLDKNEKYLLAGGTEFQGEVFGNIAQVHAQQATGDYVGYATLTATVGEVK